jgi:hypothetical protein
LFFAGTSRPNTITAQPAHVKGETADLRK